MRGVAPKWAPFASRLAHRWHRLCEKHAPASTAQACSWQSGRRHAHALRLLDASMWMAPLPAAGLFVSIRAQAGFEFGVAGLNEVPAIGEEYRRYTAHATIQSHHQLSRGVVFLDIHVAVGHIQLRKDAARTATIATPRGAVDHNFGQGFWQ